MFGRGIGLRRFAPAPNDLSSTLSIFGQDGYFSQCADLIKSISAGDVVGFERYRYGRHTSAQRFKTRAAFSTSAATSRSTRGPSHNSVSTPNRPPLAVVLSLRVVPTVGVKRGDVP